MADIIGVVGAGTMGAGIAQVAATAHHPVYVYDAAPGAAMRAVASVHERLASLVERGKLDLDLTTLELRAVEAIDELQRCAVVIEAIVEDLAAKQQVFIALEGLVAADCVLATNTSSLSPTAIAASLRRPERFVGLHFFNPPPVMRLVEVVPGLATSANVVDRVGDLARAWGKTVVRSTPTPAFIVNRVARPFYGEAWRLLDEQAADAATIDAVLTGAGGFRMGPFELMDLIGHDVNEVVTRTVWTAFGNDTRFAPSLRQRGLVEAGWYGRKSGRGVYDYRDGAPAITATPALPAKGPAEVIGDGGPALEQLLQRAGVAIRASDQSFAELSSGVLVGVGDGQTAAELAAWHDRPVVVVDRTLDPATASALALAASADCSSDQLTEAVGLFQSAGLDVYVIEDVPGLIVTRTVAMLVNLAIDALAHGVASGDDIDTAMQLGTNYPLGPLEWGRRWGLDIVLDVLDALETYYRDGHYRAGSLLRRTAASGRKSL